MRLSARAATALFWLLLVAFLPLPYFMIESGRIPAAELLLFAAATTPLAFTDPGVTTAFAAIMFTAQSVLYGALLFVAARALVRRLPADRRAVCVLIAAALLGALASMRVYRAPLSHGRGATNIIGVFR